MLLALTCASLPKIILLLNGDQIQKPGNDLVLGNSWTAAGRLYIRSKELSAGLDFPSVIRKSDSGSAHQRYDSRT
jgi:hypothetical protein